MSRPGLGQRGFTMVEVLIAMSIFFLILAGIFQVFGPSNTLFASGQRKVDVQQSARVAMDTIVRQVRMSGYFPENFDDAGDLNNVPATDQNPVQIATDAGLAVFGASNGCLDAGADGLCDPDQSGRSQVFLFCLNGMNLLRKIGALGAPGSYDCSIANADQDVLADNITGLTFAYLDGNNVALPGPLDGVALGGAPDPLADWTQRAAVRTVVITLTAQENIPGQPAAVYTLSSNVRLRNLN